MGDTSIRDYRERPGAAEPFSDHRFASDTTSVGFRRGLRLKAAITSMPLKKPGAK